MQIVSQTEQEILRVQNLLEFALSHQPVLNKLSNRLVAMKYAPKPAGCMEVSQPTGRFLDVGLKLINCVVESLVTLSMPCRQSAQQLFLVLRENLRDLVLHKAGSHFQASFDWTNIQERSSQLKITGIETILPGLQQMMAYRETQIPQ